jgi:molecular chaperone DnaK (HSP70)
LLAIGVDLGTTFSVVGVRMGGKVKIIEDEQRRVIFPSVVSYLENGGLFLVRNILELITFVGQKLLSVTMQSID